MMRGMHAQTVNATTVHLTTAALHGGATVHLHARPSVIRFLRHWFEGLSVCYQVNCTPLYGQLT